MCKKNSHRNPKRLLRKQQIILGDYFLCRTWYYETVDNVVISSQLRIEFQAKPMYSLCISNRQHQNQFSLAILCLCVYLCIVLVHTVWQENKKTRRGGFSGVSSGSPTDGAGLRENMTLYLLCSVAPTHCVCSLGRQHYHRRCCRKPVSAAESEIRRKKH